MNTAGASTDSINAQKALSAGYGKTYISFVIDIIIIIIIVVVVVVVVVIVVVVAVVDI